jgi:hypothetical protein
MSGKDIGFHMKAPSSVKDSKSRSDMYRQKLDTTFHIVDTWTTSYDTFLLAGRGTEK